MSKSKAPRGRRERTGEESPAPVRLHPVLASIRERFQDRRERRLFLLLTIPVLLAQYFFWSWMDWSAIVMVP